MRSQAVLSIASMAAAAHAASNDTAQTPRAVPSLWDGQCFYPTADGGFQLETYLGRWYQVAGTLAPFTAGCKCIYAQYALNDDGNVQVNNTCEAEGRPVNILGTASPADPTYGLDGAFRVQFPGQPAEECPGPNYIVQDYANDIAIVQSSNFTTLFILSREQHLEESVIQPGGTAGCIVASRLAEASPELSILVIEGGANNYNEPIIVNPALYLQNLAPCSITATFHKANKSEHLAQRELVVPCGGVLGGGSSINFMMYTRAQQDDYDSWKTPGWSADELRPFLRKLETYHGTGAAKDHGFDGPVHISSGSYRSLIAEDDFIEAGKALGYPEINDLQSLDTNNGVSRWLRYVSPEGKRQDTAHTYLHPKLQAGDAYPNLHVVVQAKVLRVLIDGDSKRAVGVEYTPNPAFQALGINLTQAPTHTVRARKLVILSSGACGTPAILERSGVGDPKILQRAGVPVLVDLPGVGHDYQDHHLIIYPYRTNLAPEETIDGILRAGRDAPTVFSGNKLLGWNAMDAAAKLRPTEDEVQALGPEFKESWDRDFRDAPNRPLMLMVLVNCFLGDQASVPVDQYASIGTYTAYPYSRGHMHITGPELKDPLDFDVGYFSDANDIDLKKLMWAYKKQRELMRRTKMYRGELAIAHPRFPEGSKAACTELDGPLELGNVRDVEYSAEDDAAIEAWIRENVGTTWHALGTAKMAPREKMGVVQPNLDVHGVKGLKIADLSIPPENVGANTNNTALMIGEKAADIIMRELGLQGTMSE
ncbi:hypothetical protein S7711_05034 [Stachybotrys chartarum IBT 7711]|uniref:Glucose-methanol-choline oxidoreductase N-terminal domain-containing protein n=1 Tax=Stachybotrys chartarum (strain CBS 109288 / IBT 7711) TaxID=1280523 RepID=A0A084BAM4_STACB|nr:hypothetical protein S7711_05034 [Stachybotrys chartarum IBT 7711]